MTEIVAQAFLFDSQIEGLPGCYGDVFDDAFLKALADVDPQGVVSSQILRGDLTLDRLCDRVVAVSNTPKGGSSTWKCDMDLYSTLLWDLADAFAGQWSTLDLEEFPLILARKVVYCIMLTTFPNDLWELVDANLNPITGYLGSLSIDLGSPLQRRIFIDFLIKDAFVSHGTITLERSWEGVDSSVFNGAEEFLPGGERRLGWEYFREAMPPLLASSEMSERGRTSLERFQGKKTFTIQDRVFQALSLLDKKGQPAFDFRLSRSSTEFIEAELPEAKFVQYLLNTEHKKGAGKAKFFYDTLGIGPADWRYLAAQFYEGLRRSDLSDVFVKGWKDGFGVSFNCVLSITGLNGRTANVFTNWIMNPGGLPQLSTAKPEPKEQSAVDAIKPYIVPPTLPEQERWAELYRLARDAGERAAETNVPTPMKIGGHAVEMEGACGSATVRIPDARRGFARWAVQTTVGHRHYKGGAAISCHHINQSVDRALQHAKAFAEVLQLNGVSCTVERYID